MYRVIIITGKSFCTFVATGNGLVTFFMGYVQFAPVSATDTLQILGFRVKVEMSSSDQILTLSGLSVETPITV